MKLLRCISAPDDMAIVEVDPSKYVNVGDIYKIWEEDTLNYCDDCYDDGCCDPLWCLNHKEKLPCVYVEGKDGMDVYLPLELFTPAAHTVVSLMRSLGEKK